MVNPKHPATVLSNQDISEIEAAELPIPRLNLAIRDFLTKALNDAGKDVVIRFDMPDPELLFTRPTVSVFLYDIQEDLELRQSGARQYDPQTQSWAPGRVNVRCCYLLTYWGTGKAQEYDAPEATATGAPSVVMSLVLAALLNNREIPTFPGTFTRVIPPAEHLDTLGSVWQAMGNKPRLCLNYSVTIPIELARDAQKSAPVVSIDTVLEAKPAVNVVEAAENLLWQTLLAYVLKHVASDEATQQLTRQQLRKVVLSCEPAIALPGFTRTEHPVYHLHVAFSGVATEAVKELIETTAKAWKKSTKAICEVNGVGVFVTECELTELVGVELHKK